MRKLKPCPFCGSTTAQPTMVLGYTLGADRAKAKGRPEYFTLCMKCLARGPERKSYRGAASAWNAQITTKEKT